MKKFKLARKNVAAFCMSAVMAFTGAGSTISEGSIKPGKEEVYISDPKGHKYTRVLSAELLPDGPTKDWYISNGIEQDLMEYTYGKKTNNKFSTNSTLTELGLIKAPSLNVNYMEVITKEWSIQTKMGQNYISYEVYATALKDFDGYLKGNEFNSYTLIHLGEQENETVLHTQWGTYMEGVEEIGIVPSNNTTNDINYNAVECYGITDSVEWSEEEIYSFMTDKNLDIDFSADTSKNFTFKK